MVKLGKKFKKERTKGNQMCKIMAIPGVKPANNAAMQAFIKEAATHMSDRDRDGFGYAAITAEGKLFGERWLTNSEAFKEGRAISGTNKKFIEEYKGVVWVPPPPYNRFGELDLNKATSIMLHARMATTPKGIENTHPFVAQDELDTVSALIHNGVVDARNLELVQSTCDSEGILNSYIGNSVTYDPNNIQLLADEVSGSYACGVLSTDNESKPIMDIFKNNTTALVMARVTELDTLVFCTTMEILEKTCKALTFTLEFAYYMKPGMILRFDAVTGERMAMLSFKLPSDQTGGGTGGNVSSFNQSDTYKHGSHYGVRDFHTKGDLDDIIDPAEVAKKVKSFLEKH